MIKPPYKTDWTIVKAINEGITQPFLSEINESIKTEKPKKKKLKPGLDVDVGVNCLSLSVKNTIDETISIKGRGPGFTISYGFSLPVKIPLLLGLTKSLSGRNSGIGNIMAFKNQLCAKDFEGYMCIYTVSAGVVAAVPKSSAAYFTNKPFVMSPNMFLADLFREILSNNIKAVGCFYAIDFADTLKADVSASLFLYQVTKTEKITKKDRQEKILQIRQQQWLTQSGRLS